MSSDVKPTYKPVSKRAQEAALPRWRMIASSKPVIHPNGAATVRCINDAGHAVDILFSRELWSWSTSPAGAGK
jgi:hypothetical protein